MLTPSVDKHDNAPGVSDSAVFEGGVEPFPDSARQNAAHYGASSTPPTSDCGSGRPPTQPSSSTLQPKASAALQPPLPQRAESPPHASPPAAAAADDINRGGGSGVVRHTDYLGNFIRDPARLRAAVEVNAYRGSSEVYVPIEKPNQKHDPTPPQQSQQPPVAEPAAASSAQTNVTMGVVLPPGNAGAPQPSRPASFSPSDNPTGSQQASPVTDSQLSQNPQQGRQPAEADNLSGNPYLDNAQPSRNLPPPTQAVHTNDGHTVTIDPQGYVNVDAIPVRLSTMGRRNRPWHYGLCRCCRDCDSCVESWCCLPCQVSRQCNMLMNEHAKIHWPFCLLITFTEFCTGCLLVACLFAGQSRRMARERYGIAGSGAGDCCTGFWCRCCAIQQVLLEMTIMNDFPGATSYKLPAPTIPQGDVEMR